MTVLTFADSTLYNIVVSTAAYGALVLASFLYLRMRSLRRLVSALLRDAQPRHQPQQAPAQNVPASPEGMSAEVARWARSTPAPHESGEPTAPGGADARSEQAQRGTAAARPDHAAVPRPEPWSSRSDAASRRLPAPMALPAGHINSAPHGGNPNGAVGVASPDLPAVVPSAAAWAPVPAEPGRGLPLSGGVFIGGNGKGQDRARVTYNRAAQPSGWYAYAVVCDGVGGIGDGAVAADTALESFNVEMARWLDEHRGRLNSGDPNRINESLERGVRAAHIATRELSRNPLQRGSSTTLDAALVIPTKDQGTVALVTHIGDGALWTLDARGLRRLPTGPAAAARPLGAELELSAELHKVLLPPGTWLVLTSDGFEAGLTRGAAPGTDALTTVSSIAATLVVKGSAAEEIAHCIGGLAAASSLDDVTVVVVG